MTIELFIVLFVIATVATFLILIAGVKGRVGSITVGRRLGVVLSAAGAGLWMVIAINSFDLTIFSGGEEFSRSYEQLAWVAVCGATVSLYAMLQAALEEIQDTGGI